MHVPQCSRDRPRLPTLPFTTQCRSAGRSPKSWTAEAFEAEHPDISVEAIYAGNYLDTTTRALTAARAGTPPTVAVLLATDIFTLIDEDVIQPIRDFIETDEDQEWVDGFMPAYLASAQIEGELWSVPFQRSTAVLYYNKEAFEAAGLDPDSPPTTWDEMVEYGKAVTESGRWGVGIPGSAGAGQWLFGALVAQNGGTLASEDGTETYFTDPAVVEALQFWVDLNAVHGIHPPGVQEWGTTPSDFLEGRLVMAWTTTGNLTNIRSNATFDFGVAPYPGNPEPASVLGGGNLYIFCERGAEAGRFRVRQVHDLDRIARRLGHSDRLRCAARRLLGDGDNAGLPRGGPGSRGRA